MVDATVATLAGVAGVAAAYAVVGFTPDFVVAPVEAIIRDLSPSFLVSFAIEDLGPLGHRLLLAGAVLTTVGLFAGAALVGLVLGRSADRTFLGAPAGGLGAGAVTFLLTGGVGEAVAVAAAVAGVVVFGVAGAGPSRSRFHNRRSVIRATAGATGISVLGLGSRALRGSPTPPTEDLDLPAGGAQRTPRPDTDDGGDDGSDGGSQAPDATQDPATTEPAGPSRIDELLSMADERSLDVDGIDALVTPANEFFHTTFSNFNPPVDRGDWTLEFYGADANEFVIDFDDLLERPYEHRFVTLRCVGEPLNGQKLDNALWTGTPIGPLIDQADPNSECGCVRVRAADDYYQVFPIEVMRRAFLAFGMNGEELPRASGYPVRLLTPGHWGEINVKWITEIEFLEEEATGYWEQRGWHGTGPVKTVAKLHAVNKRDDGTVQVGGHAYAGLRGVSAVEVSTDGGETWNEATISERLPGEDVWRQWAYEYEPDGRHEVVVRAVEDDGTVQPDERTGSFPSGPSGWVSKTVTV